MFRSLIMSALVASSGLSLLALPAQPMQSGPAADDDETYLGESPERYVQVKRLEGSGLVRKGELEEALERGVPLTEGDVVTSRGRGVLQLADGSRIAFGEGATFTLAGLFVERKDERQVILRLDRGSLRIGVGAQSQASYRVDTPAGRLLISDRANVAIEMEADGSARVKVYSGRARFANDRDKVTLASGERLTVYSAQDSLDRIRDFNTYESDPFDRWAGEQLLARRSESYDRVPKEIRYYTDDLDEHGEWVQVEDVGTWCWRPRGLSVEWRPYWRGRWGSYAGGMTWISEEPWGYVTHHHGRWGWSARWGWYWIPGVYYSPAWVAWHTVDSFFGWAPLGYWNRPVHWGWGHWNRHYCWNIVDFHHLRGNQLHTRIYAEARVIDRFGSGIRVDSGYGGGAGRLTQPWQTTPVVLTPNEWRTPGQLTGVLTRDTQRQRLTQMERQNPGRVLVTRGMPPSGGNPTGGSATAGGPSRVPFDRLMPPTGGGRTPILRDGEAVRGDARTPRESERVTPFTPRPTEGGGDVRRSEDGPSRRTESTDRVIPQRRDIQAPPTDRRSEATEERMRPRPEVTPHRREVDRPQPRAEAESGRGSVTPFRREERIEARPAPRAESRPESRPAPPPPRPESRPAPTPSPAPSRDERKEAARERR